MTQIKLRRDTSAAFASSNPILGNGEPAYETDTKKLKIGDGTTAYTQLEYFSAGGGGSTNISATLPLKIVDGVISLEVDGQTIQIVDGKLHANLDELGNKVNSLTGEVTDLSGRVTTVEGEVAKKEDEITALKPITLEKKVISSLTGMSYTSDGTRLYAQSITLLATESNWDSPNITYNNPVSYIDIPLDINKDQVITIPRFRTSYSVSEAATFMLGSYDANGLFYPIFFQAKGNSNNGLCWLISNNYPEAVGTTYFDGIGARGSSFGALNVSSDKVYIQAKYDESSGFYIRTFGAYPDDSSSTGLQIVYTSPADIERLRQITACRFINMGKMNTAATATLATLFGRYDGAHLERGTLPDLTNIPNSFSLTDVQSLNYLQLNLGSGLSVVDGKLTASSTAPTNMVTTDTAQTISGNKELTGITTISNDIKFTIGKKITTPDGQWLMQLGAGFIGIGTSMKPLQTYDGSNYYLHNKSIIAGNGIKITEPNSSEIEISSTSTGGGACMPSDRYVELTLGASDSTYTAPANGWFTWYGLMKGTLGFSMIRSLSSNIGSQAYSTYSSENGLHGICSCPVKKGDVVELSYYANTSITTTLFRFVYAEGSK